MVRVSIATLAGAAMLFGTQPVLGQSAPVSQSEIHQFVTEPDDVDAAATTPATPANTDRNSAADDACITTSVCPVKDTKTFSFGKPLRPADTRPNTPATGRPGRPNLVPSNVGRGDAGVRRTPAALPRTRRALDMRLSFEKGSSELTPEARKQADVFATELIGAPANRQFVIEGHTDNKGSVALNRTLSRQRAQSVVEYLVSKGVPRPKLRAVGYAFDHPRDGMTAADPSNRRVEIVRY